MSVSSWSLHFLNLTLSSLLHDHSSSLAKTPERTLFRPGHAYWGASGHFLKFFSTIKCWTVPHLMLEMLLLLMRMCMMTSPWVNGLHLKFQRSDIYSLFHKNKVACQFYTQYAAWGTLSRWRQRALQVFQAPCWIGLKGWGKKKCMCPTSLSVSLSLWLSFSGLGEKRTHRQAVRHSGCLHQCAKCAGWSGLLWREIKEVRRHCFFSNPTAQQIFFYCVFV